MIRLNKDRVIYIEKLSLVKWFETCRVTLSQKLLIIPYFDKANKIKVKQYAKYLF